MLMTWGGYNESAQVLPLGYETVHHFSLFYFRVSDRLFTASTMLRDTRKILESIRCLVSEEYQSRVSRRLYLSRYFLNLYRLFLHRIRRSFFKYKKNYLSQNIVIGLILKTVYWTKFSLNAIGLEKKFLNEIVQLEKKFVAYLNELMR